MKSYKFRALLSKVLCVLAAVCDFAAGSGLRVVRPVPDQVEWIQERNGIIKCYVDSNKDNPPSKVVPLFIAVKLNLGDPIVEYGAVIREFAYVYSENKNKNGTIKRSITVLARSPYEDRIWSRFDIIIENDESLSNVLALKPEADITGQVTVYSKQIIGPLGLRNHIISVIFFDNGATEVFGKKLDDEVIRSIFS